MYMYYDIFSKIQFLRQNGKELPMKKGSNFKWSRKKQVKVI